MSGTADCQPLRYCGSLGGGELVLSKPFGPLCPFVVVVFTCIGLVLLQRCMVIYASSYHSRRDKAKRFGKKFEIDSFLIGFFIEVHFLNLSTLICLIANIRFG